MRKKRVVVKFFNMAVCFFIFWSCDLKTKEKYVLPNHYRGFFGVIYQADSAKEMNEVGGYRIYNVTKDGVCESGFRFSKSAVVQEFYFENGEVIESFGFQMISYLKDFEIDKLKKNKSKIFALYVFGTFINGGENSVGVYLIATGEEILKMLPNTSKIVSSMRDFGRHLIEEENIVKKYIYRLNEDYSEHRVPFD